MASAPEIQRALKAIPSVDRLLGVAPFEELARVWRREALVRYLQLHLDAYRKELRAGNQPPLSREEFLASLPQGWARSWQDLTGRGTRRILNGTGVLLHTNLGRAALCPEAREAVAVAARWPVDLELDLDSGKRASRLRKLESLLCVYSGAPAALAVNNNAAALTLAVDTLARKRRLIVSRGEQVEIGGSFRLPEILDRFASRVVEVGTTNRTRLSDYADAITRRGDVLLKVHPSNFRQEGYVESTSLTELSRLGVAKSCPVIYDLGSGRFDLDPEWLDEPFLSDSLAAGPSLITFSGDKVFGGPQAGIALGTSEIIAAMRANPLSRSLRLDKLSLAALQATLSARLRQGERLPAQEILARGREEIESLAADCKAHLDEAELPGLRITLGFSEAASGGGAAAESIWPSAALQIDVAGLKPAHLARRLRAGDPAVLGLVRQDAFYLDFAALTADELPTLKRALLAALATEGRGA